MTRDDLEAFLTAVRPDLPAGSTLFLVAETSQVWEGWIPDARAVHVTVHPRSASAEHVLEAHARQLDLPLLLESPAEVIPLPAGHEERARQVEPGLAHFDPVSAGFRGITRGDEADYHLLLRYLEHDWCTWDDLVRLFEEVLPRFTRETIAQDPAEFRRKFRGLKQMWRAQTHEAPGM